MYPDLILILPLLLLCLQCMTLSTGGLISTIIVLSIISHIFVTTDPHVLLVWHAVFLLLTMEYVHLCAYHIWFECSFSLVLPVISLQVFITFTLYDCPLWSELILLTITPCVDSPWSSLCMATVGLIGKEIESIYHCSLCIYIAAIRGHHSFHHLYCRRWVPYLLWVAGLWWV